MSINKSIFLSLFVLLTTSCSQDLFITHNGNMPINERISQVKEGQSKAQVQNILGTPSSVVSLDENTWIYMSCDIKKVAFFKPEEVNRDVLTIKFDDKDQVRDIQRMTKVNGKEISVSEDKTVTAGHQPGFFEKFFGGVTQFLPLGGNDPRAL
ncbi:MAG: outer membrane protein assembly factor BamE [Alphaproteobacteria bacterium]|nr:outer membrane protein assembly factor BamE [Alphaproteobacteria bacterium]